MRYDDSVLWLGNDWVTMTPRMSKCAAGAGVVYYDIGDNRGFLHFSNVYRFCLQKTGVKHGTHKTSKQSAEDKQLACLAQISAPR